MSLMTYHLSPPQCQYASLFSLYTLLKAVGILFTNRDGHYSPFIFAKRMAHHSSSGLPTVQQDLAQNAVHLSAVLASILDVFVDIGSLSLSEPLSLV